MILILNGPTERVSRPSVTLIVMSAVSPTSASVGVPVSAPVSVLNVAHVGLFSIVNSRKSSSASDACGVKEYGLPASTPGSGVPVISGAEFTGGGGRRFVRRLLGRLRRIFFVFLETACQRDCHQQHDSMPRYPRREPE